jgi:alkylation response protein AidB-like acyl-CoA dehydrogenase
MDFDFSEEQYLFRDTLRGYLREHYAPPSGDRPVASTANDRALWPGLAELGTYAIPIPEACGGLGLGFVDLALLLEEFGRRLVPASVIDTLVAADVIARFGTPEQRHAWLPSIAEGKLRAAIAITEPDVGYDLADLASCVTTRNGALRLDGSKILVADAVAADLLVVAARFSSGAIGLVVLDPKRGGVHLREHPTLDCTAAYHEVGCDAVAVGAADVLGGAPSDTAAQYLWDACAVAAAALMTGIAGEVLDTSVEYVKQRTQFGKAIGSFQAIKHKCADMALAVDSSRSAAYFAAWSLGSDAPRTSAVSGAKSFCGDTARLVCNEGIQLHGGVGFTWALGLHFYLRRAKVLEYSYGDATFHRQRVLAAALGELVPAS